MMEPADMRRQKLPLSYQDEILNCLLRIQPIITLPDKKEVSLDILIDILTDPHLQHQSLELTALKIIRKDTQSIKIEELAKRMKKQIEGLPLAENLDKWQTTFKTVNAGSQKGFQVRKIRECMRDMQSEYKPTIQEEQTFKYRDMWSYGQLVNACSQNQKQI